MAPRRIMTSRLAGGLPGLLLAVLAIVSQLAAGAIVLPGRAIARDRVADRAIAALDALTVLCDSSAPAKPGQQPVHHPRPPDCAICPAGADLSPLVAILASVPEVPPPPARPMDGAGAPPQARAPPQPPRLAKLPRGPPHLA